ELSQPPALSLTSVRPLLRPKPAKTVGKPPGFPIFNWKLPTPRSSRQHNRVPRPLSHAPDTNDVPFHPTTLASRAFTFKGFLTTLTLPREEVVAVRGPTNRAQPPFSPLLPCRVLVTLPSFLSLFPACSGFGTSGAFHDHPDMLPRSPTNPTLHLAVVGVSVPSRFPVIAAAAPYPGNLLPDAQTESSDSQDHLPDSFPRASRLGNAHLLLREVRIFDLYFYEVLMCFKVRNM
ncbi:hypothetical protein CRG98_047250, partial [Punica granatum]